MPPKNLINKWVRGDSEQNKDAHLNIGRFKLVREEKNARSEPAAPNNNKLITRPQIDQLPKPQAKANKDKFRYVRPSITALEREAGPVNAPAASFPSKPPQPIKPQLAPTVHQVAIADGSKERVMVYTKGNNSLVRTGVRAVEGGKRSLTWRNPDDAAAPIKPAAGKIVLPALFKKRLSSSGALPRLTGNAAKWNKYVRPEIAAAISPAPLVPSAAAGDGAPALGKDKISIPATLRRRSFFRTGKTRSKMSSEKSKAPRAQQLLRLGGNIYQVFKKGNSKSLKRQDAAPSTTTSAKTSPTKSSTQPTKASTATASTSKFSIKPRAVASSLPRKSPVLASLRKKRLSRSMQPKAPPLVYCPVYCHTGKCPRRDEGCPHKHDPTKRAVCTKWLRGECTAGKECPLQHQRKPELMPVCMHYLKGLCTANNCPYLHINVSRTAPVCPAFMRGYCSKGNACPYKHYTLRMVREERRLKTTKTKATPASKSQKEGDKKAGKKKRTGRYFDEETPGTKRQKNDVDVDDTENDDQGQGVDDINAEVPSDDEADQGEEGDNEFPDVMYF